MVVGSRTFHPLAPGRSFNEVSEQGLFAALRLLILLWLAPGAIHPKLHNPPSFALPYPPPVPNRHVQNRINGAGIPKIIDILDSYQHTGTICRTEVRGVGVVLSGGEPWYHECRLSEDTDFQMRQGAERQGRYIQVESGAQTGGQSES